MNFSDTISAIFKIRRYLMLGTAILGGVGGAGYKYGPAIWHGHASHPAAKVAAATTATNGSIALKPGNLDLGEVTLTNHCETSVQLSNGKNCTLLARSNGRNLELTVALKSSNSAGQTSDLTVTQVSAKSGKPMEVALGDCELSFTPKIEN